jgi:hypothetical protein
MKLCKNCAHYRPGFYVYPAHCARPLTEEIEPVNGAIAKRLWSECSKERRRHWRGFFRVEAACGPFAIFFEPAKGKGK